MNKSGLGIVLSGALMLGLASTAQATLFDRGGGMIYDSDQDLTWLQDANYARTSGYDSGGHMNWSDANAWAASLTVGNDRTWTDPNSKWRLPTVTDMGISGCNWSYSNTDCGYNIDTSGSELGYMWYNILGNTAWYDTSGTATGCNTSSPWCLTSTGADGINFQNLQSNFYWSGTEYAPNTDLAWLFDTSDGTQDGYGKDLESYAWAVRSGDVAGVPEPAMLLLFGLGLAGLGVARRGQSQR